MNSTEELVKQHCLRAVIGNDSAIGPEFLTDIKNAIEFSITGDRSTPAPLARFTEALTCLVDSGLTIAPSSGFSHLDFGSHPFDPLWTRVFVLRELKMLSGLQSAVLLISGLREAVSGPRKYWTRQLQKRYSETISYIDGLAIESSAPSTKLNLIYI